jgi:hypothetical protein
MRDSEFAMARLACRPKVKVEGEGVGGEEEKGWWVDFGRDRDGRKFEKEFRGILKHKDEKQGKMNAGA